MLDQLSAEPGPAPGAFTVGRRPRRPCSGCAPVAPEAAETTFAGRATMSNPVMLGALSPTPRDAALAAHLRRPRPARAGCSTPTPRSSTGPNRDVVRRHRPGAPLLAARHDHPAPARAGPGRGHPSLLVLSPHGHVEHHAGVTDDGTTTLARRRARPTGPGAARLPAEDALHDPRRAGAGRGSGASVPGRARTRPARWPGFGVANPGPRRWSAPGAGREVRLERRHPQTHHGVRHRWPLPGGVWPGATADRVDLLVPRDSGSPPWPRPSEAVGRPSGPYEGASGGGPRAEVRLREDRPPHDPRPRSTCWPRPYTWTGCYRGRRRFARVHNLAGRPGAWYCCTSTASRPTRRPAPGTEGPPGPRAGSVGFVGTGRTPTTELGMIALAVGQADPARRRPR